MDIIHESLKKIYKSELQILLSYSVIFFIFAVLTKLLIIAIGTDSIAAWISAILLIFSAPVATICMILFIPLFIYAFIQFNKVSNLKKEFYSTVSKGSYMEIEFKKTYTKVVYINLFFILVPVFFILINNL